MSNLLDITGKVIAVTVTTAGLLDPFPAYTDGRRFFFDDATVARIGEHLTGQLDLAGRTVRVQRTAQGWQEQRGTAIHLLHQRHIVGGPVYRFDDEWLFTPVTPGRQAQQPRSN